MPEHTPGPGHDPRPGHVAPSLYYTGLRSQPARVKWAPAKDWVPTEANSPVAA